MTPVNTSLDPEQLRGSLLSFWGEALSIERPRQGLTVAMPQTGADGCNSCWKSPNRPRHGESQ